MRLMLRFKDNLTLLCDKTEEPTHDFLDVFGEPFGDVFK